MKTRVWNMLGALALAGVLTASCSSPEPAKSVESRPAEAPRPAPPPPPAPKPAPAPEPAKPEPRRRAAPAPKPEPAPEPSPAPVAADPELVTLRVESDVPDAQVFIDRTFVGKTPLTTTDVKVGSHKVNVSAPGFEGVARDVTLSPGANDLTFKLREVRLNVALDVVHKHRIGSCKGRLVATPQGIRYETADKDDAFRAALLDLETFEVDYLEKNLKIRPKGGKSFNFTDPEGKADNLFVFHRDVEKARDRLKKGDPPASQD